MADIDRFQSEILSMTTAQPGWTVRATINGHKLDTHRPARVVERWIEQEDEFPVVAWAVVLHQYPDGTVRKEAEPVFLDDSGRLMHETLYRYQYSDIEPQPGRPKITVSFKIVPPSAS